MKIDPDGMSDVLVQNYLRMEHQAALTRQRQASPTSSKAPSHLSRPSHPRGEMSLKEKRFSSPPPPSSPDHGLNPTGLKLSFDPGVVGNVGQHVPSVLKSAAEDADITSIRFSSIDDGKSHANNSKHYLEGNPGMDISVLNGLHVEPGSALVLDFQKAIDKASGSMAGQNFGPDYFSQNGKIFSPSKKLEAGHQRHMHIWIKKKDAK